MKMKVGIGLILAGLLSGAAMADEGSAARGEFYVNPGIALTGAGAHDYKNSFSLDAAYLKAIHQVAAIGWEAGYLFGSKLEGLNRELEARGFNYLLFLRLVPLFPFFLINLAGGLTRLPLRTFVVGTLIGIIPGGFVFVNAGASLAAITTLRDVASPRVLGSFALLGLFALLPALYSKIAGRKR